MANVRTSRRASVRARRRLKLKLPHCRSFTADIGAGGFSAEVLRVLPPGTSIDGSIELGGRSIPFAGRVAWAKAGDPYNGIRGRMGILFTSAVAELRDLVPSADKR
jgi:hypothetical protein